MIFLPRNNAQTLVCCLALVSAVYAVPRAAADNTPAAHSTEVCYTQRDHTSAKHHDTYTHTTTTSCKHPHTKTVTTTKTVTPSASTIPTTTTITRTLTAPATTSVATDTTTIWQISNTDTTTTTTTTETDSVSTVSTSTISAAGFTPVETSLPGSTYDGDYGGGAQRRDLDEQILDVRSVKKARSTLTPVSYGYPGNVYCWVLVTKCSTVTSITTATSTASQHTSTHTVTATFTTTITPGASSTTTSTETDTITITTSTSTATSTSTTTSTIYTSTLTTYQACPTSNFADYVDGNPISSGGYQADGTLYSATSGNDSPYDCCVAAVQNPSGSVWFWATSATCYVVQAASCSAGQESVTNNGALTGSQVFYVLGNANCGEFTYSEPD